MFIHRGKNKTESGQCKICAMENPNLKMKLYFMVLAIPLPQVQQRSCSLTGFCYCLFVYDYMTEINVTSPTGIWEIRRFDGTDIASLIWGAIERKTAARA